MSYKVTDIEIRNPIHANFDPNIIKIDDKSYKNILL